MCHVRTFNHGQGFGWEVQDGADDEVEEEAAGEILPGESEAVHDTKKQLTNVGRYPVLVFTRPW